MNIKEFVRESNRIEGIHREPSEAEVVATQEFLALPSISVADVEKLVAVYAPGKPLRRAPHMNVRVGTHIAPPGGPDIEVRLTDILVNVNHGRSDEYDAHQAYETLHPFMDGNGRSGRAIWLWQMTKNHGGAPLGFLHHWYYQSLQNHRG